MRAIRPARPLDLRLLLGVGLAGALVLALGGVSSSPRAVAPGPAAQVPARPPEAAALESAPDLGRRPLRGARVPTETRERQASTSTRGASERELLDAFLERERARPGVLAEQALSILDGTGPASEKVALLRALRSCGSPREIECCEHAVHSQAAALDTQAAPLAEFALGVLCQRGPQDERARAALARLAFESPAPEAELRRRAACSLARCASADELARLRVELRRERDEVLVQAVLAVLEERDGIRKEDP